MDGFGFSEAFGHANHIYSYPAATQKQVLDLLFSPTVGIGATILRNRIGSGGSGDSILPNSPGCPTCTPSYVWDGTDGQQVWLTKQALSYGVKYIYANAWSAPGFMKTNNDQNNGGNLCGVSSASCSSGDWKQAYANFLVQYVKYYQQAGIAITHLGFLNEPEYTTTYSSMRSTGTQAADFIKVLSPALKAANLSSVQITCCDSMGWSNQITMTNELKSAGVESSIGVITSHAYSSQPGSSTISTSLKIWVTEHADLSGALSPNNWYSSGGAGEGMTWANSIWAGIVNSNLSAYLYWIGAEPGTTNSALILTNGTTITASKRTWAFAQWSRYVRPGAVRLGTSGSGTNLRFSAFKNTDGTLSVQVLNNGGSAASINVATSGFTTVSASGVYSAQGTDIGTLSVTVSGGVASASVPAHGMATFILKSSGSTSTSTNLQLFPN
ncbi:glycoside hydrolase [Auriculariales sp. MPI-PUGE-AT-0066]|nr:glycoside hydrolase [Auriculariales sp. MPI-PUGE-AT-0066]